MQHVWVSTGSLMNKKEDYLQDILEVSSWQS